MDVTAISDYLHKFYKTHVDYAKEDPFNAGFIVVNAVIFFAILPWGAKFWLKANGVLLMVTGFFYLLFPERGVSMLVAFCGLSVIADGHAVLNCGVDKKKISFNSKAMLGYLHFSVSWLIASLVYTLKQQNWGGYTEVTTACRNTHLRLAFVLWFASGLLAFIFPKIICDFQGASKMDPVEAYSAQCMGLGFITMAVMSGRASNFLHDEDKKAVLLSHVLASVILLGTIGLCQIFTGIFTTWHAFFGMVFFSLTGLNAIMGCDPRKLAQQCMHCLQTLVPSRKFD